jgi:hypothetical protein
MATPPGRHRCAHTGLGTQNPGRGTQIGLVLPADCQCWLKECVRRGWCGILGHDAQRLFSELQYTRVQPELLRTTPLPRTVVLENGVPTCESRPPRP